jgi:hypothetical protein
MLNKARNQSSLACAASKSAKRQKSGFRSGSGVVALALIAAIPCLRVGAPVAASAAPAASASNSNATEGASIDFNRLRPLMEKVRAGQPLTPDEQAYVDHAKEIRRSRMAQGNGPGPGAAAAGKRPGGPPVDTSGLVPLTDLTGAYKGEDGGLYGGNHNEPPAAHRAAYLKESAQVQPLDAEGKPSKEGKIGLITIGFSNTSLESEVLKATADTDPQKASNVFIVNGAIGSRAAVMWAYDGAEILPLAEQDRLDKEMDVLGMPKTNRKGSRAGDKDTWPTLQQRINDAGLSPYQVQVLWMKHVEAMPRRLGDFPTHAKALEADMKDVLIIARKRFPNLRVAYLSSRTYGGWAGANSGSPEPFAYECAFAVRWLIQSQIQGEPALNFNPERGEVKMPLLVWGPYLWANGDKPRKYDGLVWSPKDVRDDDHMHPSEQGRNKVTAMLLDMLKTDQGASRWFLKPGVVVAPHATASTLAETAGSSSPVTAASAGSAASSSSPAADSPIDPTRARALMEKSQSGATLTAEEQAYLARVRQELQRRKGGKQRAPLPQDPNINRPEVLAPLVPLTELTGTYKGQDGGLYGGGHDEAPAAHLAAARKATAQIQPLDAQGQPAEDGRIVLMSVGLSHTTMEFSQFKKAADADPQKSDKVIVVDGAQGGKPSTTWALSGAQYLPAEEVNRLQKEVEALKGYVPQANRINEWDVAGDRLKAAGVTPQQVQVIWLKESVPMPSLLGEFPVHARSISADMISMITVARKRYPNLRLVYLSSRSYGGYARDGKNPEPYAYENAFAVRWTIQAQIQGDPRLNYDPARGPVTAPVTLWGPYLWAHGTTPRKSDGLVWEKSDFGEIDGMHPSPTGKQKVVEMLLKFFKTDLLAKTWFVKSGS